MKLNVKNIRYIPSESFTFRGTKNEVTKYKSMGYDTRPVNDGSWLVTKHSYVEIKYEYQNANGETICGVAPYIRNEIMKVYSVTRLMKSTIDRIRKDVEMGKIEMYMDINYKGETKYEFVKIG